MVEQFPCMPALRHLGDLADLRPVIVIDTREQEPLVFSRLESVKRTLHSGDYSFRGGEHLFAVERKSTQDLVLCCMGANRDRFERELHRLRGFRFARLLIVGTADEIERGCYRSKINPKSVLHTLAAFEARYVPVVLAPTPEHAALMIEQWTWWFARELVEAANDLWRCRAEPNHENGL